MKERFKKEVKYYVELNNKDWGLIFGAVLGSVAGAYIEKNYVAPREIEDLFIKLLLLCGTVPAAAGFFAALFAYAGKTLDVVFHDTTLLNWFAQKITYCRNSLLDARDEELFFAEGRSYKRRNPTHKGALILRHVDSEMSEHVIPGSSNDSSPREASSIMKTKGYQSGDMISVTLESGSGSTSDAEEAKTPITSRRGSMKYRCCC